MQTEPEQEFDTPSKSQKKRDAHLLQALGERLTACSAAQLRKLEVPEPTITAIAEFNRLPNSRGARRRQLQFIGKLMRKSDFEQLSTALALLEKSETHGKKPIPATQQWVNAILLNGDPDINSVVASYPQLQRQKLRQYYRDYHASPVDSQAQLRKKMQDYLQAFIGR